MTRSVRIPADVDREDRILACFTPRQVAVFAVTAGVLYAGWQVTRAWLPVVAYLVVAVPLGIGVALLVVLRRDAVSLDRLLLAAVRQRLHPRRRVSTPSPGGAVPEWLAEVADDTTAPAIGGLDLPAQGVGEAGVVDLGRDGVALVAACSTVNFALRTPDEQDALTAGFGRYLHSLTGSIQILVRAQRLDLSAHVGELRQQASALPHPALETAALDHADYLDHLGGQVELLRRQILLVLREPVTTPTDTLTGPRLRLPLRRPARNGGPPDAVRRAATARLTRRVQEAGDLLAPAGIDVSPLDADQATTVLTAATNPDAPLVPTAGMAAAHEVITTAPEPDDTEDTP
ncbi:PrgI family protein [Allosaccharopolyspora coralli]|uniref:PrgI family protein n=1 Tax=Allosaccharopolyspora coralli TaxID=2665642 RepID=A0A5Q3QAC9_9PSEU|nr:PrgI family protein [Allosaccharopolyspora coralli]QGK70316.1 PrgI family protein [Allosaccharopolyspora coralli]